MANLQRPSSQPQRFFQTQSPSLPFTTPECLRSGWSLSVYSDNDHHISYGRSSIEDLKAAYFDQIRRDELRHRVHRSIPTPSLFAASLSSGGFSLPNIAEAANESSENSSSSSVKEKVGCGGLPKNKVFNFNRARNLSFMGICSVK